MAKPSATAAYLLESYQTASRKASAALRDYLGDPSDVHAHDLRSSLRRVDALLRLLPKDLRSRPMRDYDRRCRRVLKLTSPIRDLDVLTEKLRSAGSDPAISSLSRRATRRRRKLVKDSMKASWKLFEMAHPELEHGDLRGIDARVRGLLGELDGKIFRLLPKVLASEGKIEEMHSLRKRCKRLRYVIETSPPSEARKKAVEVLKSWQDILGAIRDSDLLIDYLKDEQSHSSVRELLRAERIRRHALYAKFQRGYRANFGTGESSKEDGGVFIRGSSVRAAPRPSAPHRQR